MGYRARYGVVQGRVWRGTGQGNVWYRVRYGLVQGQVRFGKGPGTIWCGATRNG